MSISYERTGRTQQKARTRDALIAATRRLLAKGTTPTVEQAAAAAHISRATAYRYFPNQRTLLAATYPLIDMPSLLPTPAPPDPAARLAAVADARQPVDGGFRSSGAWAIFGSGAVPRPTSFPVLTPPARGGKGDLEFSGRWSSALSRGRRERGSRSRRVRRSTR